jgi:hypothetical protein
LPGKTDFIQRAVRKPGADETLRGKGEAEAKRIVGRVVNILGLSTSPYAMTKLPMSDDCKLMVHAMAHSGLQAAFGIVGWQRLDESPLRHVRQKSREKESRCNPHSRH